MEASRILPDLQSSLLCEDVRQEASGNFIVIGIIGVIRVPKLPVKAYKLCVFNRWTAGVGEFTEEVRIVGPDQTTPLRKAEVKFRLQDPAHHATNVSLFGQVEFTSTGIYYIEVVVDEVMKLRYPLPVVMVQSPKQQGQGGETSSETPPPPPSTES